MDLQFLRYEIYKIACKYVKIIKRKNKIQTLTDYLAGSLARGPLSRAARPADAARDSLPPARALTAGPLVSGTQWQGRGTRRHKLIADESAGEIEGTSTTSTPSCTGGPSETRGGATREGSSSRTTAWLGGGGAPRRR
jgi:hypothetical protein